MMKWKYNETHKKEGNETQMPKTSKNVKENQNYIFIFWYSEQ